MIDNISRYKTFVATAESASVSEAARKLFVSQPAVSAEIAALESALSVKLFFRSNRGVTLTPEGQILYDYVKKAFSFLAAGEEKLREITGLRSGTLRIGASDMTLRFYLLDFIAAFHEAYPDVHLNVTNAPTPRTLESLRSGVIDFGVVSEPINVIDTEDFEFLPVREIHDIFIAAPSYGITRESLVTNERLAKEPIIMLEPHTSTRSYVSEWLGSGFPSPAIELATSDLLLEFAERGFGVASIVEDFAKDAIKEGRVLKLDLASPAPPRRFFVVYLKKLPLSAAGRKMLEMLGGDVACAL